METVVGSAIVVGIIGFIGYVVRSLWIRKKDNQLKLNLIFSEMLSLFEHYCYAYCEFPGSVENKKELKKRLIWSKYGELKSMSYLEQLGFLKSDQISLLLQVSLRVRNNDSLLEYYLKELDEIEDDEAEDVIKRMKYGGQSSYRIIKALMDRNSKLSSKYYSVEKAIKIELKGQAEKYPNNNRWNSAIDDMKQA